ncbi:hypothetical protein JTE90_018216 [Oedothorax gibbosus]|uniref:Uncharacterized protein n=1 Tax=Oedothorax gibbosus TaxID=931172 RepID=A0AAV6U9P4_9ARAC|nr:hypothetical protein JTE90_018216 [Oedothorax gibbosus]
MPIIPKKTENSRGRSRNASTEPQEPSPHTSSQQLEASVRDQALPMLLVPGTHKQPQHSPDQTSSTNAAMANEIQESLSNLGPIIQLIKEITNIFNVRLTWTFVIHGGSSRIICLYTVHSISRLRRELQEECGISQIPDNVPKTCASRPSVQQSTSIMPTGIVLPRSVKRKVMSAGKTCVGTCVPLKSFNESVMKRISRRLWNIAKTTKNVKLADGKPLGGRGRLSNPHINEPQNY